MKQTIFMVLCAGLCVAGGGAVAEDMTVNRLLASQCAQCHGTNGHAAGNMDGLDDESYKDLYEDLMDMRSEDRPEDIMDHQAFGYTEDQIRRIAAYFGMRSGKSAEAPEFENAESEGESESERRRERRKSRRERDDD